MNQKELNELMEKAKAAAPGAWQERIWHGSLECASGLKTICFMSHGPIHERQKIEQHEECLSSAVKDAEFIAAANPQVVLDLCERVLGLSESIQKIQDYQNPFHDQWRVFAEDTMESALERFGVK